MSHRTPQLPDAPREPLEIEWRGFSGLYLKAIGITILLGLITGILWIGWRLLRLHVIP